MRTQLWKLRGGTTTTFVDRARGEAASVGVSLLEHIERQLRMLSLVLEEVKAADKQMKKLAGEHPVCRRLMTVPGIGPLSAVRFVAAIDDLRRLRTRSRSKSAGQSLDVHGNPVDYESKAVHWDVKK